jgi:PAS domain S-box-containing protein
MGQRIRAFDWAQSPLGPLAGWPVNLRVAVELCLNSRFPMFVWWGADLINIYNDAYAPMMGGRHPAGLGASARDLWREAWSEIGPQTDAVLLRGQSTWNERRMLMLERNGYPEECYFTWSYSPILDESGRTAGIFCSVTEETARVLAERERDQLAERYDLHARRFEKMLDSITDLTYAFDLRGRFIYASRRLLEIRGIALEELVGRNFLELGYPPDLAARFGEQIQQVIRTRQPLVDETSFTDRRGYTGYYQYVYSPVLDADGNVEAVAGVTRELTDKRRISEERERLLQSERAARAEAENASLAKDKFLAMLSHELRTPLSPVVMTIPAIESDPELPQRLRDDLAMVRRNIALEVNLIDDLLDLSRITTGKLRLQTQIVSVHELLSHMIRSSQADFDAKHLQLTTHLEAKNDWLAGDAARLQQVFWNLLRNAIKFTPDRGKITIRSSDIADVAGAPRLAVEIQDSGVGIAPEILPRVFDAFEQGDARTTRQFGGLGLGLAISKAVVEMHGGRISASSGGHLQGSLFRVELAVEAQMTATASSVTMAAPAQRPGEAALSVLLVEDHVDTARAMARLLKNAGCTVSAARSVAAALQMLDGQRFDIMVSDIGLPDAAGYELMRIAKDRHGIIGIALSGYGMEDDVRKSKEAGFSEHIVKPVHFPHLLEVLRRVTGKAL